MLSLLLCLAASSSVHAILHAQNTSVEPEAGQANKFSQYLKCHKVKKKSNTKNAWDDDQNRNAHTSKFNVRDETAADATRPDGLMLIHMASYL